MKHANEDVGLDREGNDLVQRTDAMGVVWTAGQHGRRRNCHLEEIKRSRKGVRLSLNRVLGVFAILVVALLITPMARAQQG